MWGGDVLGYISSLPVWGGDVLYIGYKLPLVLGGDVLGYKLPACVGRQCPRM